MNTSCRLEYDWKFAKAEGISGCEKSTYDDGMWKVVRVPHDYAIEGPFNEDNDSQFITIIADGIKKPIKHTGRTGGLPITDHAWYRRSFEIADTTKRAFLEFDGIMSNSEIYVNGVFCGGRPYGYSSFCVEITKAMIVGVNVLAVFCAPEKCASRWYTGAGIYRNVRLRQTAEVSYEYYFNHITSDIDGKNATINNTVTIRNDDGKQVKLVMQLLNANCEIVASAEKTTDGNIVQISAHIEDFIAWDVANPYLYVVRNILKVGDEIIEERDVNFGIREIKYHPDNGFFLNGKPLKFKGVCMHHDLGALGAAINIAAMERQLDIIMQFGANALRTSHNPPAPELLDLCDKKGILVLDEAFDEWKAGKVDNGYAQYFKKWSERDLTDFVRRDINHPSVVIWSIGNEIHEQWKPLGGRVAARLAKIVRAQDTTRPITIGFNAPKGGFRCGLTKKIDIIGLNYQCKDYDFYHKKANAQMILGSETSSCVSSRGEYYLPAVHEFPVDIKTTKHMSSYDLCGPGWASTPDEEFFYQDKGGYNLGEFVWTGFDYLGEPTPYNCSWPSRSSYFGIVDLAGMRKDRFYSYKSKWSNEDTIHIFPHWNWSEGQKVDVHCYCTYARVELFLNGKSLGIAEKGNEPLTHHRLMWKDVVFEAGTLKAVAVDKPDLIAEIKTVGEAFAYKLTPEKTEFAADGESVVYIRCDVVDIDGMVCPKANNLAQISVLGAGEYLAADNGSQTSTRTFSEMYCDAFNGSFMIIVRSIKRKVGEITVSVAGGGIEQTSVVINAIARK